MSLNEKSPTPPVTKNQSLADILNEIESRANAATPGPWEHCKGGSPFSPAHRIVSGHAVLLYVQSEHLNADANFDFTASARTDVPKLVKALREAQMGFEVIADMAEHAEPHSSNYAKVKLHDLSLILTSPENGEQQSQSLGEPGAV